MAEQVMTELTEHQKRNAADAAAKKADDAGTAKRAEAKAELDFLSKELAAIEARTLSGAPSLTPKEIILDLSDLQAKHPDKVVRWVNIKAPGVADRRRLDGYIRLPESEGGREIGGEVAVFVTSKRLHEHRVAELNKATEARLRAHRTEVENTAEAIAKELRDKYGISINAERILVNEE